MKHSLTILIAIATLTGGAKAITIQTGVGFNPGVNLLDYSGTITTSYQFAIGTFLTEPTAVSSFAGILSAFNEFTRATVPANARGGKLVAPGPGGAIAGVSTPATRSLFDNREAYFFIGNGSTLEMSTEFVLIKGNPVWRFPADTTGASSMNAIASSVAAITPIAGSLRLVTIPEPRSGFLAVLVAIGFLSRRRCASNHRSK